MLILVADDDPDLVDIISYALRKDGHKVVPADCGQQALDLARRHRPDAAILDVMMPPPDGFEVCRQLRQESPMPILLLTARGDESNKVWGLDLGADDYMTKPFSHRELRARVRALGRRVRSAGALQPQRGELRVGRLRLDADRHEVWLSKRQIAVTPKEYDLLYCLMLNAGNVVSHDALLDFLCGGDTDIGSDSVRVHVRHLREKIERDPADPDYIVNVRGVGYKLRTH